MRAVDIEVGAQYRIRQHVKGVKRVKYHPGHISTVGYSRAFPSFRVQRVAVVVRRAGWRTIVEWSEPDALHKIPETPMRWGERKVRVSVNNSQVLEKVA